MFGLVIAGRPVYATPERISETKYLFRIEAKPAFDYMVVFLLPDTALPMNACATVYMQTPPSQEFRLVGGIWSEKESAIFRIAGIKEGSFGGATTAPGGDENVMTDDLPVMPEPVAPAEIVVGISIEIFAQVETQLQALKSTEARLSAPGTTVVQANVTTDGHNATKILAKRIIGNAFNFLASFGSDTVPLKAFEEWWKKFEKKIELDPTFLEREGNG